MGGSISEAEALKQRIKGCKERFDKSTTLLTKEQCVLFQFHHIHHFIDTADNKLIDEHKVHHCGKTNEEDSYEIKHCSHGKHCCDLRIIPCVTTNDKLETVFPS